METADEMRGYCMFTFGTQKKTASNFIEHKNVFIPKASRFISIQNLYITH